MYFYLWIRSPCISIIDPALSSARVIPDLICFMSLLYSKWPSPRYAVKHIALCFLPSPSNPLHNFSLSFLALSLFPPLNLSPTLFFFSFKRNFWQHGTISEPFVGLRHVMRTEDAHWTVRRPPSPTQAFHSNPSLSSSAVIGLDVIPTLTLMCWDVVCKLIADILGTWCQRFFISRFPLSSLLHVCVQLKWSLLEMLSGSSSLPTLLYTSPCPLNHISFLRPGTNGST